MSSVSIEAKKRDQFGTRNVKKLRSEGFVPGIFYISGKDSVPLSFEHKMIFNFLHHAHGLIDIKIEGNSKTQKCVLKDVQFHPVTEDVVHVDFLGINMDEIIRIEVPVVLKGEAVGEKTGGVVQQPLRELNVECMPEFLPDRIEIDITHLDINDTLQVKEVVLENIVILNDENDTIALVDVPKVVLEATPTDEELEGAELEDGEEAEDSDEADEDKD